MVDARELLENRCAKLMTEATPVYRQGDLATSTGIALFGQLRNTAIELLDAQPSRSQRAQGLAEGSPYCRFLLTHDFGISSGDHVIVVGANPSGARSFQGDKNQERENPQSDETANRLFDWVVNGRMSKATNRIKRLSVVNLSPIVEKDPSIAKRILKTLDLDLLKEISIGCLAGLSAYSSGQTHVIFAHGKPENKRMRELANSIYDGLSSESLWQLDFSKNLKYPPHPLHRSTGSRFIGVKPYKTSSPR